MKPIRVRQMGSRRRGVDAHEQIRVAQQPPLAVTVAAKHRERMAAALHGLRAGLRRDHHRKPAPSSCDIALHAEVADRRFELEYPGFHAALHARELFLAERFATGDEEDRVFRDQIEQGREIVVLRARRQLEK